LDVRKDFEVALHAGTAAALLLGARAELARTPWLHERRAAVVLALALGPPALVGLSLESTIERLGEPRRIAGGLLAGSLALALADRLGSEARPAADAGPLDGLLLGLAQAVALVPGISRNGATLAAARARGFGRGAADELSRDCGLPVILGAVALRGLRARLGRRGSHSTGGHADRPSVDRAATGRSPTAPTGADAPRVDRPAGGPERRGQLVAGTVGAFASTLVARGVLDRRSRPVSLVACACYRAALAGVVLARLGRRRRPVRAGPDRGRRVGSSRA
jgi:undecaprenyl-diphosphatase